MADERRRPNNKDVTDVDRFHFVDRCTGGMVCAAITITSTHLVRSAASPLHMDLLPSSTPATATSSR
ncbi:hypothetical protein SNOG_14363 [Parastagonospora nodorum SN15]|uniref:Uncharacterized protein n=1 Tax=Phaeosphaeria nodorum (strain SN15 / ATCC MYA-4574 / FGSC 10173) TaxID=321614 RepID=Q0U1I1_PHANO|nr:hypothetical protein SNOG_14363 [Parastagonospora nodorum SN15]EAT78234.1 hypothetical protein SNOG_14363 [Parastagonospora nodorum SN15]